MPPRGRVRLCSTPTNGKLKNDVMLGGLGIGDMKGSRRGANSLCNIGISRLSNLLFRTHPPISVEITSVFSISWFLPPLEPTSTSGNATKTLPRSFLRSCRTAAFPLDGRLTFDAVSEATMLPSPSKFVRNGRNRETSWEVNRRLPKESTETLHSDTSR